MRNQNDRPSLPAVLSSHYNGFFFLHPFGRYQDNVEFSLQIPFDGSELSFLTSGCLDLKIKILSAIQRFKHRHYFN